MDYKDTLNLPLTDFPMKANLNQREPEMLAKWESDGLYNKLEEAGNSNRANALPVKANVAALAPHIEKAAGEVGIEEQGGDRIVPVQPRPDHAHEQGEGVGVMVAGDFLV